jgi:predicted anti-sigma-YlaC factor YlaD
VTCPETASGVGAYVLGALDPGERRRFEEHLVRCPACAAELDEFRSLPALLARVRPQDVQPVSVTPSPELFARMSAAAATRRPRRSRTWALVAAAVLVVLGIGAGVTVWATGSGEQTSTASAGPVHATVIASAADDGSILDVAVSGLRPRETCRLVVVDRDGNRYPAGEWPASDAGDGRWRGWADVDRSAVTEVVLLGDGARELVRVPL